MGSYNVIKNNEFIGRTLERKRLVDIEKTAGAKILVVYGRRRVGKTELLEQSFRHRNLLKFEGIERKPEKDQMQLVMKTLSEYVDQPLLAKVQENDWVDVLKNIASFVKQGVWTLYFEELQWLADYKTDLIAALKYVWDNFFRHNKDLLIILCGSSPSFMINQVLHSQSLYNRSQYELPLKELNVLEARQLLDKHSLNDVMDTYLTVGGMPEYLLRFKAKKSVYLSLSKESFMSGAFFSKEYSRIFTSSMASNKHYKSIIHYLSSKKFATRNEILKYLKVTSGGDTTSLLEDLVVCGFIEKYTPYNLASTSTLARYGISDAYLHFYFQFIQPIETRIDAGDFDNEPSRALKLVRLRQWLGYAFERFCRKYHRVIAAILGFRAVQYKVGSYFSRNTNEEDPGFQIDLVFDRDDKVISVCEIRYTEAGVSSKVIAEVEKKLENLPNPKNKTIERVLIASHGIDESLKQRSYFDVVITLEDLFDAGFWV